MKLNEDVHYMGLFALLYYNSYHINSFTNIHCKLHTSILYNFGYEELLQNGLTAPVGK